MTTAEKWIKKLHSGDGSIEAVIIEPGNCSFAYDGSKRELETVLIRVWRNSELLLERYYSKKDKILEADQALVMIKSESELLITGFDDDEKYYYFGCSEKRKDEAEEASEAVVYIAAYDEIFVHGVTGHPLDYQISLSSSGTGFFEKMAVRYFPEEGEETV